jgi:hypothetical protein
MPRHCCTNSGERSRMDDEEESCWCFSRSVACIGLHPTLESVGTGPFVRDEGYRGDAKNVVK